MSQPACVRSSRKRDPKTTSTSPSRAISSIASDVVGLVLPVGIKGDDPSHPGLRECVLEAGLESRPLAKVDGVRDEVRPGLGCGRTACIVAPVVDAHDVRQDATRLPYDVGDHTCLVVQGDDQPDVVVHRG